MKATTKTTTNRPRCIIGTDGMTYNRRRELDTHGLVGYRSKMGTRALLDMGQFRATLRSEHGQLLADFVLNGTTCTVDCRPTALPSEAELDAMQPWWEWRPTTEYGRLSAEAAEAASAVAAAEFRLETGAYDAQAELESAVRWQSSVLAALSQIGRAHV